MESLITKQCILLEQLLTCALRDSNHSAGGFYNAMIRDFLPCVAYHPNPIAMLLRLLHIATERNTMDFFIRAVLAPLRVRPDDCTPISWDRLGSLARLCRPCPAPSIQRPSWFSFWEVARLPEAIIANCVLEFSLQGKAFEAFAA